MEEPETAGWALENTAQAHADPLGRSKTPARATWCFEYACQAHLALPKRPLPLGASKSPTRANWRFENACGYLALRKRQSELFGTTKGPASGELSKPASKQASKPASQQAPNPPTSIHKIHAPKIQGCFLPGAEGGRKTCRMSLDHRVVVGRIHLPLYIYIYR